MGCWILNGDELINVKWIVENNDVLTHAAITAVGVLIMMIVLIRINGLRSFAKMSGIDFVTTIAIGSVIASSIMTDGNSLVKSAIVVSILLVIPTLFEKMKIYFSWFGKLFENSPILLLHQGKFIEENMKKANVSRSTVIAKLREANAYHLKQVHAVVLETTGDISVLHGEGKPPDDLMYEGVRK